MTPKEAVHSLFNKVNWINEAMCEAECPGKHLHTGKTGKKDCRIYIEGAPTIYCFHSSCSSIVEEYNLKLRQACSDKKTFEARILTEEEKNAISERKRKEFIADNLKKFGATTLSQVLSRYEWPVADAWEDSPIRTDDCDQDWLLLLTLFSKDDIVWSGEVTDSGSKDNTKNFLRCEELAQSAPLGRFTCPSTFKPGSFSRANENVVERKFLVIESDHLNQDEICAIFSFCRQFMSLKAIVFTGGKSLHGWFNYPSNDTIEILKVLLPSWKCDPALFKASQPVRMPGIQREPGKYQSLIYFNP